VTCSLVKPQAEEGKRHRQELASAEGSGGHRLGDSATAATAWRAALNPLLDPSFGGNGMSAGMPHSVAPAPAPLALQVTKQD
jgi:hypothetical protein